MTLREVPNRRLWTLRPGVIRMGREEQEAASAGTVVNIDRWLPIARAWFDIWLMNARYLERISGI